MSQQIHPDFRATITGVVLAGGAGSRFNFRDKALLPWRERPFIAHIIDGLTPQVTEIIVNSNSNTIAELIQRPTIPDPFPDRRGPLAGMLAGLDHSPNALTLFVPCDSPHIAPDLTWQLHAALHNQQADIAYATTSAGDHYLHVLMRTHLRERLRLFLANGSRAVRHWYAQENSCRVAFSNPAYFANINTPDALAQLS